MANQRFQIQFDFQANMNPIKTQIQDLQKTLGGINLPPNIAVNFEKLFGKLDSEMSDFQAMAKNGFNSMVDVNKAQTSFNRITKLINQISGEAMKVRGLDPNKLIPKEAQARVESLNKKFSELKTQQSKKNSYAEQIKKQTDLIQKQEKELSKLGATQKALKEDQASLSGQKGAATKRRDKAQGQLNEATTRRDALIAGGAKRGDPALSAANSDVERYTKAVQTAQNEIDRLTKNLNANASALRSNSSSTDIAEKELQDLRNKLTGMQSVQVSPQGLLELRQELAKLMEVNLDEVPTDLNTIQTVINGLNSGEVDQINQNLRQMDTNLDGVETSANNARGGMQGFVNSAQDLDRAAQDMENFKNQALHFFSITNSVQLFKRALTSALNTVKELDATMTEAAVVTEFSVSDMWDKLPEYSKQAQALGVSINGMYQATTLYYQQGLRSNEAMALGIETMKMAKIAGLESGDATQYMTAALRGFNMELNETSAVRVNDVYSQLAAVTAADTAQIATAMSKTASIAASANMEFETTAAFLSQIIETTQEAPETAGTALKTIIARFSEVKELQKQGLTTGEDEEGEEINVNKIDKALKSVGISMNDYFAGVEGLDSVLLRLAEKWGTLDFETQRYIATMAAGSRQQSRFIAMMSDYERTTELVQEAENSAGASQEQFNKTLESMDSKLQKLENAWKEFLMGLSNNEILKGAVDFLTFFIEKISLVIDNISGGNGLVKAIVSLVTVMSALSIARSGIKGIEKMFVVGKGGIESAQKPPVQEEGQASNLNTTNAPIPTQDGTAAGDQYGQSWIEALLAKLRSRKGEVQQTVQELTQGQNTQEQPTKTNTSKKGRGRKVAPGKKDNKAKQGQPGQPDLNISKPADGIDEVDKNVKQTTDSFNELGNAVKKTNKDLEQNGNQAQQTSTEVGEIGNKAEMTGNQFRNSAQQIESTGLTLQRLGSFASATGATFTGLGLLASMLGNYLKDLGQDDAAEKFSKISEYAMSLGMALMILPKVISSIRKGVRLLHKSLSKTQFWLAMIAIAIAAIMALVKWLVNSNKKASVDERIEKVEKRITSMTEKAEEAKKEIEKIGEASSSLNNLNKQFDNLVKGTTEWKQQLVESNEKVLELLDTYPSLIDYIETGEHGEMVVSQEGWGKITEEATNKYLAASGATIALKAEQNQLFMEKLANSRGTGLSQSDYNKYLAALAENTKSEVEFASLDYQKAVYKELFGEEKFTKDFAKVEDNLTSFGPKLREITNEALLLELQEDLLVDQFLNTAAQGNDYLDVSDFADEAAAVMGLDFQMKDILNEEASKIKKWGTNELYSAYSELTGEEVSEIKKKVKDKDLSKSDIISELSAVSAQESVAKDMEIIARQISVQDKETQKTLEKLFSKDGNKLRTADIKKIFGDKATEDSLKTWLEEKGITLNDNQINEIIKSINNVETAFGDNSPFMNNLKAAGFNEPNTDFINQLKELEYGTAMGLSEKILEAASRGAEEDEIATLINTLLSTIDESYTDEEKQQILFNFSETDWLSKEALDDNLSSLISQGIIKEEDIGTFETLTNNIKELTNATYTQIDSAKELNRSLQMKELIEKITSGDFSGVLTTEEKEAFEGQGLDSTKFISVDSAGEKWAYAGNLQEDAANVWEEKRTTGNAILDQDYQGYKNAQLFNELEMIEKNSNEEETEDINSASNAVVASSEDFITETNQNGGGLGSQPTGNKRALVSANQARKRIRENIFSVPIPQKIDENGDYKYEDYINVLDNIVDPMIEEIEPTEIPTLIEFVTDKKGSYGYSNGVVWEDDFKTGDATAVEAYNDYIDYLSTAKFDDGSSVLASITEFTYGQIIEAIGTEGELSRIVQKLSDDQLKSVYTDYLIAFGMTPLENATREQQIAALKGIYNDYNNIDAKKVSVEDSINKVATRVATSDYIGSFENYNFDETDPELIKQYWDNYEIGVNAKLSSQGGYQFYEKLKDEFEDVGLQTEKYDTALKALASDLITSEQKMSNLNTVLSDNADVLVKEKRTTAEYSKAWAQVTYVLENVYGKGSLDGVLISEDLMEGLVSGSKEAFAEIDKLISENAFKKLQEEYEGLEGLELPQLQAKIEPYMEADQLNTLFGEIITRADETAEAARTKLANQLLSFGIQITYATDEETGAIIGATTKLLDRTSQFKPSGGGGGGSSNKWENPYDEFYNTVEKINEELRTREKLELRYERLLNRNAATAKELAELSRAQITSLETELTDREYLLAGRERQMRDIETEYKDLDKYARYNEEARQIEIDWALINELDGSTNEKLTSRLEEYISKLEEQQDLIEEEQDTIDEINDSVWEIYEQGKDEYFDLEEQIKKASIADRQREIDKLSEINDSINDTNSKLLDSMQQQIDQYRQNRDNERTEEEISDKQRRLAYLQQDTSGANALEIMKLQQEIDEAQEDYTDTLIDQKISELQQQNDQAAEQRQQQIDIMQAQLDHDVDTGAIWTQVHSLMERDLSATEGLIDGSELATILKGESGFEAMSHIEKMNWLNDLEGLIAQGLGWLEGGGMLGMYGQGATVTFKNADGQEITGTINEQGNVIADGQIYSGKNFFSSTDGKLSTTQTGDQATAAYLATQVKPEEPEKPKEEPKPKPVLTGHKFSLPTGTVFTLGPKYTRDELLDKLYSDTKFVEGVLDYLNSENTYVSSDDIDNELIWKAERNKKEIWQYKTGGLADFTGPAWLDGTKSRPEYILNADQTKAFFNLVDVLGSLQMGSAKTTQNNGDNTYDIDINVESIGSDYDVEQLANTVKRLINEDARYRNNNAINLMR